MFYVYLLKSRKDGKLYIGYTENLQRRVMEHNSGESKSTAKRRPFDLIYFEGFRSKGDALRRERKLKQFKNGYSHLKKRLEESLQT